MTTEYEFKTYRPLVGDAVAQDALPLGPSSQRDQLLAIALVEAREVCLHTLRCFQKDVREITGHQIKDNDQTIDALGTTINVMLNGVLAWHETRGNK